jgi:hypothetical protein
VLSDAVGEPVHVVEVAELLQAKKR